jgi:hypothetical protein
MKLALSVGAIVLILGNACAIAADVEKSVTPDSFTRLSGSWALDDGKQHVEKFCEHARVRHIEDTDAGKWFAEDYVDRAATAQKP